MMTGDVVFEAYGTWVVWKAVWNEQRQKWAKIPFNPRTGRQASPTNPRSWGTFEQARAAYDRGGFDGVGFVLTADDPYCGIDLDHCRDPKTGSIADWATAIIERLDSYTEMSPSGTGIRIFLRGSLPGGARNRIDSPHRIEVYDRDRYLTVTGHILGGRTTIEYRQGALDAWHREMFPKPDPEPPPATMPVKSSGEALTSNRATDADILACACAIPKFQRIWGGDLADFADGSADGFDLSAAEMSLTNTLANCGGDAATIDRLYRQWPLARAKWDQPARSGESYGQGTIARAIATSTTTQAAAPALHIMRDSPRSHAVGCIENSDADPHTAGGDVPCPELAAKLAGALARIAEIETDRDHWRQRAESAETALVAKERENTAIIATVTNPHLKGRVPTILREAARHIKAREEGKLDARGFGRMSCSSVGDDYPDQEGAPIRGRSSVKRDHDFFTATGLAQVEIRPEVVETVQRNPRTGEPTKRRVTTPVSWVHFTGTTLTDILEPFRFFAPPQPPTTTPETTAFQDETRSLTHGGDRRSERFKALRAALPEIAGSPCPHCSEVGGLEVVCKMCGCFVSSDDLGVKPIAFQDETRPPAGNFAPLSPPESGSHSSEGFPPDSFPPDQAIVFQDVAQRDVSHRGGIVFQDETRSTSPSDPPTTVGSSLVDSDVQYDRWAEWAPAEPEPLNRPVSPRMAAALRGHPLPPPNVH
jgi:putative DNA primase/helicase